MSFTLPGELADACMAILQSAANGPLAIVIVAVPDDRDVEQPAAWIASNIESHDARALLGGVINAFADDRVTIDPQSEKGAQRGRPS